jgi:hypothetical protein
MMQQQLQAQLMAQEQQAGAAGAGGGEGTTEIAENNNRAEQRSTGFKELGEALRRVERGA